MYPLESCPRKDPNLVESNYGFQCIRFYIGFDTKLHRDLGWSSWKGKVFKLETYTRSKCRRKTLLDWSWWKCLPSFQSVICVFDNPAGRRSVALDSIDSQWLVAWRIVGKVLRQRACPNEIVMSGWSAGGEGGHLPWQCGAHWIDRTSLWWATSPWQRVVAAPIVPGQRRVFFS